MDPFLVNNPADIYCPRVWAQKELAWFFPKADVVGKATQSFEVLAPRGTALGQLNGQVLAIRAYNAILERLRTIGDPHAGVLACAYAERSWPEALATPFGRLTGIMVRIATAQSNALPDDDDARAVLEMRAATGLAHEVAVHGRAPLRMLRQAAGKRYVTAFGAYERQRGRLSSILLTVE
jgi:hypothetical protein